MFMVSGILGITYIRIEIRSKIELGIMANHKEFKKFRVEYLYLIIKAKGVLPRFWGFHLLNYLLCCHR
jgi:hypothetical protein